ncbi:hypothetical protein KUTeg_006112 [Tegillarca granosa]|uniref:Uncharacterized protein n=1 Tax=Tegillarca granosa TaxID=220873 RepID=A0ABQ9FFI9_TEGGR|nr:hypothetical protein KUTeg_006112 [Tegillarca granosa]
MKRGTLGGEILDKSGINVLGALTNSGTRCLNTEDGVGLSTENMVGFLKKFIKSVLIKSIWDLQHQKGRNRKDPQKQRQQQKNEKKRKKDKEKKKRKRKDKNKTVSCLKSK